MPMVAAVATGAAEALGLQLEPSVRLQTIAVEAAGNVVAHAYPDSPGGPLQLEICRDDGWAGDEDQSCVHIKVQDRGVGARIPPAGTPPGLGLSIVSSLAERYELASGPDGGTSLDVTLVPEAEPRDRRAAPHAADFTCELEFANEAFLQPVLGRALAAQASGNGVTVEGLEEAIHVGDVIADRLASTDQPGNSVVRLDGDRGGRIEINAGPFEVTTGERIAASLRTALTGRVGDFELDTEPDGNGGTFVRIVLQVG